MTCAWCSRPLPAQRGGIYTKRFCGAACRAALHTAARRWALSALDAGLITVTTLKGAQECHQSRLPPKRLSPTARARRRAQAPAETAPPAPAGSPAG